MIESYYDVGAEINGSTEKDLEQVKKEEAPKGWKYRGTKARRRGAMKGKRWAGWGVLLLVMVFLAGCGAGDLEGKESDEAGSGQGLEQTWNPMEQPLYAQFQNLILDSGNGVEEKLHKLNCLAAEQGIYVMGIRNNQGVAEGVFYLLTQEAEPSLVAVYPRERQVAWCRTHEGIAFLAAKASETEEASVEYILHCLRWDESSDSLVETESVLLTECFEAADVKTGFSTAMAVGEELLFFVDWQGQRMLVADRSGQEAYWVEIGEFVSEIWCLETGETLVLTMEGKLYSWSAESGTLKLRTENLQGSFPMGNNCLGEDWIYAGNRQGLYAYEMGGEKENKLTDYDRTLLSNSTLWMDEAGGCGITASWNPDGDEVLYSYLTTEPLAEKEETEEEKETVCLEVFAARNELKKAVDAFNKQSTQYQVEIIEGMKTADFNDFGTQLQVRMSTGNGPDLVDLSQNLLFTDYVENGAFENLWPWIERDLNPDEYVQPALHAYEMEDGGIYALGASFILSVVIADGQMAGDGEDWSLEKMFQMMEGSGLAVFGEGYYRDYLLEKFCLTGLGEQVYDIEKLRECILFAEKYGYAEQDAQPWEGKAVPGQNVAAVTRIIDDPVDLPDFRRYYGENIVFLGYPMTDGSEVSIEFEPGGLSISATSGHKEGAWAFLKFLLGEEYQRSVENSFPVLVKAFDEMLERYQSPQTYDVYEDEEGVFVTILHGYPLNRCNSEGDDVQIDKVSEEDIRTLRGLVENSGAVCPRIDFTANLIVMEEVSSYYQGDKSLEEVLKVMEGRLKMRQAERQR